jgi:hypothetical protein
MAKYGHCCGINHSSSEAKVVGLTFDNDSKNEHGKLEEMPKRINTMSHGPSQMSFSGQWMRNLAFIRLLSEIFIIFYLISATRGTLQESVMGNLSNSLVASGLSSWSYHAYLFRPILLPAIANTRHPSISQ